MILHIGQIHLVHLRICKYFTDDSSVNFHDKVFLHFLPKFRKKWRKNLSWKFMDESSVKYLWIRKWTRWIRPIWQNIELRISYDSYMNTSTIGTCIYKIKWQMTWESEVWTLSSTLVMISSDKEKPRISNLHFIAPMNSTLNIEK